jgi:oxygen-dependent protoporphyrinogen oxidase
VSASAPHVVVAGGGIAGLSTAWYLQQEAAARNLEVTCTILEEGQRWGGKIRSDLVETEQGSFVVEGGADSFLTGQKPWGVQLSLELGLGPRLLGTNDRARKVYVLNKGKPLPLPEGVFLLVPTKFTPFATSPLISPLGKLRMGLDLVIPARKDAADETLAAFVTRRLGAEALDKIAEPLMSGIYNAEADRQSLLATFPRFREIETKYGSLIRGMLAARRSAAAPRPTGPPPVAGAPSERSAPGENEPPTVPASLFVSFRDGTDELVRGLVAALQGSLRVNSKLMAIERSPDGGYTVAVETDSGDPAGATLHADAVVLAVPAFTAADLVRSLAPDAATILDGIRYVSTGTISLAYAGESVAQRLPGFGLVIPRSEKRPLNAVTWCSTKFDNRAPAGYSLVRAFFGGSRSPGSMDLDDSELLTMTRRQLSALMGIDGDPLFQRIYRWHRANPQYDVDHLVRMDTLDAALPRGVFVTGSPYRGVGIPDCVHQARATAGQIAEVLRWS